MGEAAAKPGSATAREHFTARGRDAFPPTSWTLLVAAGDSGTETQRRDAIESLCRSYWYPVYAFIRRFGHAPDEAQDLTQEFFLGAIAGTFFARATPEEGRFRSFLLGAVKNLLADFRDRGRALKRGGGIAPLPFDFSAGESSYLQEPAHGETPERIFERKWARTVLEIVAAKIARGICPGGQTRPISSPERLPDRSRRIEVR